MLLQPSFASTRFLVILSGLLAIVLFAYYGADLTMKMTVKEQAVPLRSFDDMANSDYEVGIREGTYYYDIWRSAPPDTPFHKMFPEIRTIPKDQAMAETAMELKVCLYFLGLSLAS